LFCVSGFAALKFFPYLIFSPKTIYSIAERQQQVNMKKDISQAFDDAFVQDILSKVQRSYSQQDEITAKMNLYRLTPKEFNAFNKTNRFLSALKLTMAQAFDPKTEQATSNVSLLFKNNKMIDLAMFVDKNQLGINFGSIYNKYLILDRNNLKPAFKSLGQPNGPKRILTNVDIVKAIQFNTKEAEGILNDYSKTYIKYLKPSDFSLRKDVIINSSEGPIKTDLITLHLTNDRLNGLMIALGEKYSKDDRAINMTVGNYIRLFNLYKEAGYIQESLPSKFKSVGAFKQSIAGDLETFKRNISQDKKNKDLVMEVYLNNKFNIMKRNIIFAENKPSTKGANIQISNYALPQSGLRYGDFSINTNTADTQASELKYNYLQIAPAKPNEQAYKINLDIGQMVHAQINAKDIRQSKQNENLSANYDILLGQKPFNSHCNGIVKVDIARDSIKKEVASAMTTQVNLDNPKIGLDIKWNKKDKFDVAVQMPKIEASNSINLSTAPQAEVQKTLQEIGVGIMGLAQKMMSTK
jgi:hypothetical protein